MYQIRSLERFIQKVDQQFPILLLTGPRQVGKTTLLQQLRTESRNYVTLDDPLLLSLAKEEPALFLQRFEPPVLIDEIQYAPELLPYLKMQVDRTHQAGSYWLTGSQPFHLMQAVSESLAGRVGLVNLLGLSYRELIGDTTDTQPFLPIPEAIQTRVDKSPTLSLKDVYKLIWRGSFPAIALNEEMDRDLFYSSYVQTYLQRDIRDLAKVGDELAFLRFLRATAARTGQLLNLSDLARDADVSPSTAKHWLSILQTSGIIYLLEPYFNNITKRLVKTPKLYFLDTGLCAYLTEWSSPETLEAGAMSGPILETWMIVEILKSYWHAGRQAPLYYYRDKDKKEIDLLIIQDGTVYPLEFKKSAVPQRKVIRHFSVLDQFGLTIGQGGVLCLADIAVPLTEDHQVIPIRAL